MTSGGGHDQYAHHARAVACELFGEPNKKLSTRDNLRFGAQGSMSVNLKTAQFYSHERHEGGGVLWAIEQATGRTVSGGDAVAWMREHGYDIEDNRPAQAAAQAAAPMEDAAGNFIPERARHPGAAMTAAFDYRGPDGDLKYQVCRYEWPDADNPKGRSKTFVQRRPDTSKRGGWGYSMKGVSWLPYRLPELIADVAAGRPIFVVEGEKKVDMLRAAGVPATCNHGGAGKFPVELTEWFAGADVVLLPDNDEPGREHVALVARRLDDVARRVRVLEIPGLPPKGGVDDWLPAGGTAEQLYDLLDAAAAPAAVVPFQSHFGAVEWRDFDAPGPSYDYLIKGVLTRGEQSMLLGESQSGKSFLAIDIAMAVARGVDWFGRKVRRGGVVYQAGESAAGVRRRRFPAYRRHYDVGAEDLPVVLLERPVDFYTSDEQVDLFIEECRHWAKTFPVPLELIVIDTFNKATPGANENDGKDMGLVLARCDRIRRATGAHVMLVHHLNAHGTKARGHTSLFANVENVVTVKRIEDATDAKNRKLREWIVAKQKDGEDGVTGRFVLPAIEIGVDGDGDKITSCIVAAPSRDGGAEDQGSPEAKPATKAERKGVSVPTRAHFVLRAFYTVVKRHGIEAPAGLGLRPGHLCVTRQQVWDEVKGVRQDNPDDVRPGETPDDARARRNRTMREDVRRAWEDLYAKGLIGGRDDLVWLTGRPARDFERPPGQPAGGHTDAPQIADAPPPDLPFDVGDFR